MKPFKMARLGLLCMFFAWTTLLLAQSADTANLPSELFDTSLGFGSPPVLSTALEHVPAYRVPYYPGGQKDLIDYIQSSIDYPELAHDYAIEGEAIVEFFLNEFGQVQNPQVVKSPGFGLGKEALRIIQNMPQWEPAIINGQASESQKMRLTIIFRLR